MHDLWTRRAILCSGLAGIAVVATARGSALVSKRFLLKETAGLRRFSYPVHTIVPGLDPSGAYRLVRNGKDVGAQFRPFVDLAGKTRLALDFNTNAGPLDIETYEIVEMIEASAPGRSPEIRREGKALAVKGGLAWSFESSASGLLLDVKTVGRDYTSGRSLILEVGASGRKLEVQPHGELEVTRQGPFAVGLRQKVRIASQDSRELNATVDLTLPSSKSWIEVDWRIDDPRVQIETLGLASQLAVGEGPTLVDFGADSTVYTVLKGQERAVMVSGRVRKGESDGPGWTIKKAKAGESGETLATGERTAEGWAHVMDQRRATAIGFEGFADTANRRQSIEIQAEGKVTLVSAYLTKSAGHKHLHAWYHFVPMPVQIGAATSPQAMMNPLQVEWSA